MDKYSVLVLSKVPKGVTNTWWWCTSLPITRPNIFNSSVGSAWQNWRHTHLLLLNIQLGVPQANNYVSWVPNRPQNCECCRTIRGKNWVSICRWHQLRCSQIFMWVGHQPLQDLRNELPWFCDCFVHLLVAKPNDYKQYIPYSYLII